ncbi:osteopetrosis-associated transmembrane protein 1 isoform X2 [Episyrphus balteatus]|nr:osteopetrosis-associated transmembrane protein 1 isoform X2 [Episyrphus balteatus]
MVKYSSPANSCVGCVEQHKDMTLKYKELESNVNCSKEILNKNRLNVVYNMQNTLVDVWNKGFCDDCFTPDGYPSNETIHFINLTNAFNFCLADKNKTNSICRICSGAYLDLNLFYKQMDETKKGQICFDTQDAMNRTRSHWSKDLNCCHREYSLTLFFIASSLLTALPAVFYFGMFGYTKRMERNHEVLDAGLNNDHPSTSTGLQSARVSNIQQQSENADNSSNFEDIDKLKKQRDLSSLKNLLKENSSNVDENESLKTTSSARPNSSNETQSLIDL